MSLQQIFFNENLNSSESLGASELIAPRKIVPLTEELLHEKHCTISADVREQLSSFEQRLLNVETKIERMYGICEECTQSVRVEFGSELGSVVSCLSPSGSEEEQEREIFKYIMEEGEEVEYNKEVLVAPTNSLTELYDRTKAEERVREANFRRMRKNKQFRDLLLNGAIAHPSCCPRSQDELPTSCSGNAVETKKICKFK
ncbi:uncharacterized protein LOC135699621 [Ochlerotatus camptorhynchus]|uniref:uncharacterized protein LOC135699621 n=1 Tax=Ochlerotatus camptorhynchus TaxID=644619 RepID=UPI0031D264C8